MGNLSKILGGPWSPPEPPPPEQQLREAMILKGLSPPATLHLDGNIHRFPTGPRGTDDAGWYVAYSDNIPAGRFGDWRTGLDVPWRAQVARQLTQAEQMAYHVRIQEAAQKRDEVKRRLNESTADAVSTIWSNAGPASEDHPYLKAKGIRANGARVTGDGRLMVPLFNQHGELASLQYISFSGEKKYHTGGVVKGCFHILGDIDDASIVYIAEGFATGATIYEEMGKPTFVAYSAGNLESITGFVKSKHPEAHVVIVADNDASGVGQSYAEQASAKHGASVIVCPIPGDVNDYRKSGGSVVELLTEKDTDIFTRMGVVFGSEISDTYIPPDEIIQGIMTSNSQVVIYGDSNSGKTFWAISMAAAVAEGTEFHGKKVDPGFVVYLAAEAPGTVKERMQAYKRYFNSSLKNFAMVPMPLNFYENNGDANNVIELCKELEKKRGQPIKMIVADTLARLSSGANENSGEDMGPVMSRFDDIARSTGATMVIIHHNGKDQAKGARGWSGIRAHIDTEIEISDNGKGIKCATITKDRSLGSKGHEFYFKLAIIEMGEGKFGDMKTTCVSIPDEAAQEEARTKRDGKENDDVSLIKRAWFASGAEVVEDSPYITTSALKDYLVSNKHATEKSVAQAVKPSSPNNFIGRLCSKNYVEKHGHGFKIIDAVLASEMILGRNSKV